MTILLNFLPMLLFVTIFCSSGLYYSYLGTTNAFYQIPPNAAIIPSLIVAWLTSPGSTKQCMDKFLDGARHRDIITMCIIFLLAGALSNVTQNIGSVNSTVNFILSLIPANCLLIGFFITSALISTAIGSSLGTVATLSSLMIELANKGAFPIEIGAATLIGGAIFGDNLSVISDTTIASVMSQGANLKKKLKLNFQIAIVASIITIIVLLITGTSSEIVAKSDYSFILISPYIFLILMAAIGINVFIVLVLSLLLSGIIGLCCTDYSLILYAQNISNGFHNMHEIMLLSILVGGLSGLSNHSAKEVVIKLTSLLPKNSGRKSAQYLIAFMAAVFDILLANNTVAIIFCGKFAKEIAVRYKIEPHESATWLDIFSCIFQGIIPYGAQILLVCAIAKISPLAVIGKVYYCYILGIVALIYIWFRNKTW